MTSQHDWDAVDIIAPTNGHAKTALITDTKPAWSLPPAPLPAAPIAEPPYQTTPTIEAGTIVSAGTLAELEEIASVGLVIYGPVLKFCIEYARLYGNCPNDDVIRSHGSIAPKSVAPLFTEWSPPERAASWRDDLQQRVTTMRAQRIGRELVLTAEKDYAKAVTQTIEQLTALNMSGPVVGWPWVTGSELIDSVDTEWLAPNLIPLGASVQVDGKVKDGKTTLVQAFCKAALTGGTFLGERVTQTPIVYLTEQGTRSSNYQARQARLEHPDFHLMRAPELGDRPWPQIAAEAIRKAREVGAQVIVVDNPLKFAGLKEGGENDSATTVAMLNPILAAMTHSITPILIRHQGWSGHGRGSTQYPGDMDVILSLKREEGDSSSRRVLTYQGRYDTIPERQVIERLPGGEYVTHGDVRQPAQSKTAGSLLASVPLSQEYALSREQLAETAGIDKETAKTKLRELVKAGTIKAKNIGKGKAKGPLVYWRSM